MSHTRAGMTAYKKASPWTTVEVTDETTLPVRVRDNQGGSRLTGYYNQASEDGCCHVCAGTFVEPAVRPQSNGSMG